MRQDSRCWRPRAHRPDPPAVMYSAYGTTESDRAARYLGAVEFVCGPVWGETLLAVVERQRLQGPSAVSLRIVPSLSLGFALVRWAALIVPVARAEEDLSTEDMWADAVGTSRATVKARCLAVRVLASDSLDFGRGLRIALRHGGQAVTLSDWYNLLDIIDSRTLYRFLERGGLPRDGQIPVTTDFLRGQRFIVKAELLAAIRHLLDLSA